LLLQLQPTKGSAVVLDKENACLRMDKPLKTHRFPFCRETGVTTAGMKNRFARFLNRNN